MSKLSQPWHGPYRIMSRGDPDVTVKKIYFPDDPPIQIHQSRVQQCPEMFPRGFYWYGGKRHGPGHPPKHIQKKLEEITSVIDVPAAVFPVKIT